MEFEVANAPATGRPPVIPRQDSSSLPRRTRRASEAARCVGEGKRYVLADRLKAGGYAQTYRAHDRVAACRVAVQKVPASDEEGTRNARTEAELMQELALRDADGKERVSRLLDCFHGDDADDIGGGGGGATYMVFKLYAGTLREHMLCRDQVDAEPRSRREAVTLVRDVASALAFLHFGCGVVHTDVKPENVLVDRDPESGHVTFLLGNFGCASYFSEVADDDTVSTLPYRAPEVALHRKWSYAVDVWSFGCLLYEYTNTALLFPATDEAELLFMFEKRLGRLPAFLTGAEGGGAASAASANAEEAWGRERRIDASEGFTGLIRRCLRYDPVARCRADELAVHPVVAAVFEVSAAPLDAGRLPPSGYTSGDIVTPGATFLRSETLKEQQQN